MGIFFVCHPLCGKKIHVILHRLASAKRMTFSWTTWIVYTRILNSPWWLKRMAIQFPFLDTNNYSKPDGILGNKLCCKPPSETPTITLVHTTTLPTGRPRSLAWFTGLELGVTIKVSTMSWTFQRLLSEKNDTEIFVALSIHSTGLPGARRIWTVVFLTDIFYMTFNCI